jgi:hypothetical protein
MVQVKQLDGHDFGSLSIVSLDRAEVFAPMAHDEDAPALGGFFWRAFAGTREQNNGSMPKGESAALLHFATQLGSTGQNGGASSTIPQRMDALDFYTFTAIVATLAVAWYVWRL